MTEPREKPKVPCGRCGRGVPEDIAAKRKAQFGVCFCTDCKSDKHWLQMVAK